MEMHITELAYNVYGYLLKCIDIEDITAVDSGHGIDVSFELTVKYKLETATLFNNIVITNMSNHAKIVLSSNSFSSITII